MDQLAAIRTFIAVVRESSFSAAARHLGVPLASVSRKVSELEAQLGAQLLQRTTRSLSLTDAGRRYLDQVGPLVEALEHADREVTGEFQQVVGRLTLTSPVPFGVQFLVPVIAEFRRMHPQVRVHHLVSDERLDYAQQGIDLGLRIGPRRDSAMRMVAVGQVRVVLCASPAYLARRGAPETPGDLARHDCIANPMFGARAEFLFRAAAGADYTVEFDPVYATASVEAIREYALAGGGIGRFYSYQVADLVRDGRLVVLLAQHEVGLRDVTLLYSEMARVPQKVRAFLDFAAPRLRVALRDSLAMLGDDSGPAEP